MADISQVKLLDGTSVNIKDATARSEKVSGPSSSTANHVATFSDATGKVVKDSGFTIGKSVPSDAKFSDTTYSDATQSAAGLMSAADKTKLDGVATGATANTGTITGITMNGASKGTSGVVDLGTVVTAHQDISGKVSGPASSTANHVATYNDATGKVIKDSGFTIGKSVPSDAKFTDTTYSNATTSAAGLMSAADKTKLNGVGDGNIYNMGTFSNTRTIASAITEFGTTYKNRNNVVGVANINQSNPPADLPAQDYEWKYANALVLFRFINASGVVSYGNVILFGYQYKKIAIASINDNALDTWQIIVGTEATTTAAGLMSAADKTKLNGIATGATANTGTITGITMNGASKGTSGVVDLGTVITGLNYRTIQDYVMSQLATDGSKTVSGVTNYPTKPGAYRITSSVNWKPSDTSQYGDLVIYNCGSYVLHLYVDNGSTKNIYFGTSSTDNSGNVVAPTNWTKLAKDSEKKNTQTAVSDPTASGTSATFIATISQNAQGVISPTKKTVQSASQSQAGLMSAADKKKLDGIATGAVKISSATYTGTTNSYGFCISNVSDSRKIVGVDIPVLMWKYSGTWVFAPVAAGGTNLDLKKQANTEFTINYQYY